MAPPWVAVPPPVYGGTEFVVDNLARGFSQAGHDVRLFTTGDADCPVERRWLHPEAVGTTGTLPDELGHVQAAYQEFADADIIHDHTLMGPLWAMATGVRPVVVTTVHGPFTTELTEHYRAVGDHSAVVCISDHQRSTGPSVAVSEVIHHGLDIDRVPVGPGGGGYILFLGRMHPSKGVHRAVDIARAAGRRLIVAAKMWEPAEREYYEAEVKPRLGPDACYIGEVGGQDKVDLIGGAEALINPIRWPEPFGLVMIEALAAGTPVLAFSEGAAPEIVDHGRIGYLCGDEADMVSKLQLVELIDRAECREAVEQRFSTARMIDDHIALYRRLLADRAQPDQRPALVGAQSTGSAQLLTP